MKRDTRIIGLIMVALAICAAAPAMAEPTDPPTPFPISGYVFNEDGSAYNNPDITITNLNTEKTFPTMTLPSSNYYRADPTPSADEVNEGDLLRFTVGLAALDHRVNASDLAFGLFLNITVGDLPGDVNGDGDVTVADAAIALRMAVCGEFSDAADVSGDDQVTSLDALLILQAVGEDVGL